MSPLSILLYVVLIAVITLTNFVFWLRFTAHQKELAGQVVDNHD